MTSVQNKIVKFCGIDCYVDSSSAYQQNSRQVVLQLVAAPSKQNEDQGVLEGMPVARASTCVPDYPFEPGQTAIKDFSENSGILDALVSAGVVQYTGNDCLLGLIPFPVVRVLD